jgi:RNA polymerase sigma factor (sigma-70 family)
MTMHLTHEESAALARRWRASGFTDFEARNELVYGNRGLVCGAARKWNKTRPDLDFEDLCHEGYLVAIRAADQYDPDREPYIRYCTYLQQGLNRHLIRATDKDRTVAPPAHPQNSPYQREIAAARRSRPLVPADSVGLRSREKGPAELAIVAEQAERVREAVAALGEGPANVIRMRFGLEGHRESLLREVGAAFGYTRERARQIEHQSLEQLWDLIA